MDIIKEVYDILNYHLGEKHRGVVRVPSQHDALSNDLQRLVSYAHELGRIIGRRETLDNLSISFNNIVTGKRASGITKMLDLNNKLESKAGKAEEAYQARNEKDEEEQAP